MWTDEAFLIRKLRNLLEKFLPFGQAYITMTFGNNNEGLFTHEIVFVLRAKYNLSAYKLDFFLLIKNVFCYGKLFFRKVS